MRLEIVSAETEIFSGQASYMVVSSVMGELGIYPGHTQLLAALKPGAIEFKRPDGEDEVVYISGGILEVQPSLVTVLTDTAVRAADLDESLALEAKQRAEHILGDKQSEIDYGKVVAELAQAVAQLQAIGKLKQKATGKR